MIFCQNQEGKKGEEDEICVTMNFLCLQRKSFLETNIFYFEINIGFVIPKDENWEGYIP